MSWTLITGAAKGIGKAIAQTLAHAGWNILIHYNTSRIAADELARHCKELGVHAAIIQGAFDTPEQVKQFIDTCQSNYQNIENVINNVGIFTVAAASKTPAAEWEKIFQVNLHAPFAISQAFLPSIIQHKGAIINLGISGIESHRLFTQAAAYMSSKTALLTLTRSLAKELAPQQVRVNMVSPGTMENSVLLADPLALPMNRPGSVYEVAEVLKFLLDPKNSYITGQNIEVAGGLGL